MSTSEIAAVAGAAIVIIILIVVVVARGRKRAGNEPEPDVPGRSSMFDRPPSDTLEKLGRPEERGETPDLATSPEPGPVEDEGAHPAVAEPEAQPAEAEAPEAEPTEAEPTESPIPHTRDTELAQRPEPEGETPAEETPEPAVPEPQPEGNLVPLSSIIVTTSNKIVDLDDPEIRRMLTDLVTFEIDQAEQFREQGQTIDAVLQLTEAEKICRALGKDDTAAEIRAMMRELQA